MDIQLGDMVCYAANNTTVVIYARKITESTVVDGNIMCWRKDIIIWIKRKISGRWTSVFTKAGH